MIRFCSAALLGIILVVPLVSRADAATQTFSSPSARGVRIDWCAHWGRDCGKPAADLFCKDAGFDSATRFVMDPDIGARGINTLVFGDGRLCQGTQCSGFRQITCSKTNVVTAPPNRLIAPAPLQPAPVQPQITLTPKPLAPKPPPAPPPPPAVATGKPAAPSFTAPLPQLRPSGGPANKIAGPVTTNPGAALAARLPGGAQIYRCHSTCEFPDFNDFKIDPTAPDRTDTFFWRIDRMATVDGLPQPHGIRWQIADRPFPTFAAGTKIDMNPPGLVASGDIGDKPGWFTGDFKALATKISGGRTLPPDSFYVRMLPMARAGGEVVGKPSNVIRVFYRGDPPTPPPLVLPDTSKPGDPDLFSIKLVSFTPPQFYDPNLWGCVVVAGYDKDKLTPSDLGYKVGWRYCPPDYRGPHQNITSVGDFVTWAANGIASAFDWVSGAYNGLKSLAVNTVLKYTGVCDVVGAAGGQTAAKGCKVAAETAVDAGMVALGVPPSMPNFNELMDKGVDAAVEFAAQNVSEQTGIPCVGPCEDALREGFKTVATTLKDTAFQPGCVGSDEAHQHGREALCLPAGVIAKPAPGAIDVPPTAVVEITRLRHLQSTNNYRSSCYVAGGIDFTNLFAGGTVWGPAQITMEVPTQQVKGKLYGFSRADLSPAMGFGKKLTIPLTFNKELKFEFPWTHQLWLSSQIPAPDEQYPRQDDWYTLYFGAEARISVSGNCSGGSESVLYQRMPDRS